MRHTLADVETELQHEPPRPASAELRTLYREESEAPRKRATRQGLWIAVAAYLLYSLTDIIVVPDVAAQTIAARFIVGILAIVILEMQIRAKVGADAIDAWSATAVVLAYAGWLYTAQMTVNAQAISYYMVFGAIFMMSVNLFFSFQFRLALVASVTIMLIFLSSIYAFPAMAYVQKLTLGAFCVSCFVFTSYVNFKLNKERYKVFLNALEARFQQKEATERGKALLRLSNTDPLTGLENRRCVDQRLRACWEGW